MNDRIHGNAPAGQEFQLENGRILKNLYELCNALQSMELDTFRHHVSHHHNDFASWIRHTFKHDSLAREVEKQKKPDAMKRILTKRLAPQFEKVESERTSEKKRKEQKEAISEKPIFIPESVQETPTENQKIRDEPERLDKLEILHTINDDQKVLLDKVEQVLQKEQEMQRREQKIQEIEERIEKDLEKQKQMQRHHTGFFSKEFIQGLVVGFLVTLIMLLLYIKFIT